jgi:hypothetical protein
VEDDARNCRPRQFQSQESHGEDSSGLDRRSNGLQRKLEDLQRFEFRIISVGRLGFLHFRNHLLQSTKPPKDPLRTSPHPTAATVMTMRPFIAHLQSRQQ